MQRLARAVLPALLLLTARAAGAEEATDEARRRFDRGAELEAAGDLAGALEAYQQADELRPTFRLHRHMGRVCLGLGRYDEAARHLELFLREGGDRLDAEERGEAEAGLAEARAHLATAADAAPAGGEAEAAAEVEALPGEPETGEAEASAGAGGEGPSGPSRPAEGLGPALFWSGVAVTGAALVAGAVLGGLALAEQGSFDDLNRPDRTDSEDAQLEDHRARGEAFGIGADVLIFGGVALAVATFVVALFTDFGGEHNAAALRPGVGRGSATLALEGRF